MKHKKDLKLLNSSKVEDDFSNQKILDKDKNNEILNLNKNTGKIKKTISNRVENINMEIKENDNLNIQTNSNIDNKNDNITSINIRNNCYCFCCGFCRYFCCCFRCYKCSYYSNYILNEIELVTFNKLKNDFTLNYNSSLENRIKQIEDLINKLLISNNNNKKLISIKEEQNSENKLNNFNSLNFFSINNYNEELIGSGNIIVDFWEDFVKTYESKIIFFKGIKNFYFGPVSVKFAYFFKLYFYISDNDNINDEQNYHQIIPCCKKVFKRFLEYNPKNDKLLFKIFAFCLNNIAIRYNQDENLQFYNSDNLLKREIYQIGKKIECNANKSNFCKLIELDE